MIDVV